LATGDTRPLKEIGKGAALGVGRLYAASQPGTPLAAGVSAAIDQAAQDRQQRQFSQGNVPAITRAAREKRLDELAAKDPSLLGKATRGVVSGAIQGLPFVATGGSIPALVTVGALSSLNEPENIPLAAGLAAAPIPAVGPALRAGAGAIRRILGRGAEQIVEAEVASAAPALSASAPTLMGPAIEEQAIRAGAASRAPFAVGPAASPSAGLNAAIGQAAQQVPPSRLKQALGELSAFPRAMMSSLDISAPGRQGLIFSAAPSRWGDAIKAGRRMFAAFKPKDYERISAEIAAHPDAAIAEQSGLYLALKNQPEEFFTSKLAAKVPGVNASQRAYETYLDSLRIDTFSKYKTLIDKAGLDAAGSTKALEAASKWINIATGRGSLGKKFDDAVPYLSNFLFAPRYTASRFEILNPRMYARNFADPATRVVAKQQMKDLAQYLGAVATTFGIAKAAGADVGLNPNSSDFLKIRAGRHVYDPGAGLAQIMRFAIRAGFDLFRASKGEKAEKNQDAASLTERFIRSKLAPLPSFVWDFFSRRTYEGKDFDAFKGAYERVLPLMWTDFGQALYNEGPGGAAATLPGAIGIGVQTYDKPGGVLERAQPLFSEYTRLQRGVPEIRRTQGEADDAFKRRVQAHGQALEQFGLQLVNSDEYRNASDEQKKAALNLLPRRITGALLKQNEPWLLAPRQIMFDVKESQQLRGK
jgi:hypothetical protein